MKNFTQISCLVIGLLVAGCGSGERESREDRETVFDPLVETLDKAEAVEDLALEHKARLDEALSDVDEEEEEPEGM